jgi:hypothetical protein
MLTPAVVLALALGLALLLLILTVSVVSVLAVVSKMPDQRETGIKVLGQLRLMLRHVLDTIRRQRGGDDDDSTG